MTEDEAFEAGRAAYRAQNNPPMPDDLVAKVGALLRPTADDKPTKGGDSSDRTDEAA
jgi:hypothetical protein